MSCCQNKRIFSSSWRCLLGVCLLVMLGSLWACRDVSVSTEHNLSTLSPQELSLAFAKAVLVDNNRTYALRFVSAEMEMSVDSLLDMAGGSVEKVEDLEITLQQDESQGSCFLVNTKVTKSSLIKQVTLFVNMKSSSEKKIDSFYARIKNNRGEVIEL